MRVIFRPLFRRPTRIPTPQYFTPRYVLPCCIGSWSVAPIPHPGGIAQWVERVLYHSTRRAVPERSWVQSLLPTTEVEPGFSTFGGMLVPVLQLISPVCKTGTSHGLMPPSPVRSRYVARCNNDSDVSKMTQLTRILEGGSIVCCFWAPRKQSCTAATTHDVAASCCQANGNMSS
jgi:hypothetical protein